MAVFKWYVETIVYNTFINKPSKVRKIDSRYSGVSVAAGLVRGQQLNGGREQRGRGGMGGWGDREMHTCVLLKMPHD